MKNIILTLMTPIIAILSMNAQQEYTPPSTPEKPVFDNVHGLELMDQYRWLEDKKDPKVRKWSEDQHSYTVEYIKSNTPEIPGLEEEIRNYLDRDIKTAPFFVGFRQFFYQRKKGEQQSKLYTLIDDKEKMLFDPESYDKNGKASISEVDFTEDGSRAAVGIQFSGDEIRNYYIIDTKTGETLGNPITGLRSFSFTKDEEHAYISVRTMEMINNQDPIKLYKHKLGSPRVEDEFLFAPDDSKDIAWIMDSKYEDITFMGKGDFYSGSIMMKNIGTNEEPRKLYSSKEFKATPFAKNGKIYYLTNDNAPNFKIMVSDITKPEYSNSIEFYPEQETVLENYIFTSDYLIIQDKKDVLSRLRAYDLEGNFVKEIELPEIADVSSMSYHDETNTIFVGLSTFTSPGKIYKLDCSTLDWEFFYQDTPPIDTKNIESKLVFYPSKDGTQIPLFIVYKKGLQLNGKNPTLLYGYGGFNISMSPRYVGTKASFINRGGVYAIACIRGGAEYGEEWHKNGMMYKKQNSFDDFIYAAKFLIDKDYTKPEKLAIKGGSNGGLLVGAVTMQRPDLFNAVVCSVPLLDMVRFHKFLIARYWIPEYGDPDDKQDFINIFEYSPYHNINSMINYPTMMIKAGENDSRVDPLHAKKMAAALQNQPGQKNPIMLFIDFESGHGSGKSVDQSVNDSYLEWRFVMNGIGIK